MSLRDVERAMLVFTYFFDKMDLLRSALNKKLRAENATLTPVTSLNQAGASPAAATPSSATVDLTRSLIFSVSVCYHARLNERKEFEEQIAREFTAPLTLSGGAEQFRNEIRWYIMLYPIMVYYSNDFCVLQLIKCQEVFLESMVLGENIARNASLRENVFMMAVCVDLRIPLFLVGKPGSSKSLAKAIVADFMRGQQASQNDLLKSFKQVSLYVVSGPHILLLPLFRYICSPISAVSCLPPRVLLKCLTQQSGSKSTRTPPSMCQWLSWMKWDWQKTPLTFH